MTSPVFELLGMTGSLIVCGSVIPQVVRTFRTKSARDLSIIYLSTLMTGLILLMMYSIHIGDLVFIFGNTLSIASIGLLMGLWLRYRHGRYPVQRIVLVKRKEKIQCQ